ncbi:MAG: exostosin family protein [bacterium]|nr:exostosin family protein [bacterium]
MSTRPISFYVDPAWRRDAQHVPLLYPFWGNPLDPKRVPFQHAIFEHYRFDQSYYSITDKEDEADLVLMPYAHNTVLRAMPELFLQCRQIARRLGKPLLVDGIGDVEHPVPDDILVLRYGGYRFDKKGNEIFISPYADDLLETYCGGKLSLREWHPVPVVGFSGWASLTPAQAARTILKELPDRLHGIFDSRYRAKKKGVFFRRQALAILHRSSKITLNALARTSYSGHVDTHEKDPNVLRREFVDNLLGSDYGLDIRGDANQSTRLFEMLSLGRIPVIVDTERNFAFDDVLDYSTFSLTVDFRDIKKLPERITQFHASLTNEHFQEMQKNARNAYRNYFRVDALTRPLIAEIRKRIPPQVKPAENLRN